MNIHEDNKQIICYRFDAFCKKAMRYEARNCYKAIKRKQKREISLDYLMEEYTYEPPSLNDGFTVQPMQFISTEFSISGQVVSIENEQLAIALLQLPEKKRELILLLYFLGVTEKEIAKMYNRTRNTINYHKHRILEQLQQEMEKLEYEEI